MTSEMHPETRVTSGNKAMPTANAYHDVARLAFWPRDPHGWTFIGRAVDLLGSAMFPNWKYYSAYGLLPDASVGLGWIDEGLIDGDKQIRYAKWLINVRGDDADYIYRTNKPFDYLKSKESLDLTDDQWVLACDMSQEEWAIGSANQRMFRDIQEKLVVEAEAGRLTIASRPFRGGVPAATPLEWWHTDFYEARFRFISIDPADPFGDGEPDPERAHHLFVKNDHLTALIGRLVGPERGVLSDDHHLSPYLRLMIDVTKSLALSPSNQSKKEIVQAELNARWTQYNLPSSNNLLKAAASMLREPESQAGRARKIADHTEG